VGDCGVLGRHPEKARGGEESVGVGEVYIMTMELATKADINE
jgi:hypothetical protein